MSVAVDGVLGASSASLHGTLCGQVRTLHLTEAGGGRCHRHRLTIHICLCLYSSLELFGKAVAYKHVRCSGFKFPRVRRGCLWVTLEEFPQGAY